MLSPTAKATLTTSTFAGVGGALGAGLAIADQGNKLSGGTAPLSFLGPVGSVSGLVAVVGGGAAALTGILGALGHGPAKRSTQASATLAAYGITSMAGWGVAHALGAGPASSASRPAPASSAAPRGAASPVTPRGATAEELFGS